jgi:hypothetical protein
MKLTSETLRDHFGDLWPAHNHAFTSLLIVCREHFDGDLDEMLILSIIGDRTLAARRFEGLSYDDFRSGRRNDGRRKVINVQSIADCSGIPRETVRRKVARLIERGWVEKRGRGGLLATERAAVELEPATRATFEYFLAVGSALLKLTGSSNDREE